MGVRPLALAADPSVIWPALPDPAAEARGEAPTLHLVRKVHCPYHSAVTDNPHLGQSRLFTAADHTARKLTRALKHAAGAGRVYQAGVTVTKTLI